MIQKNMNKCMNNYGINLFKNINKDNIQVQQNLLNK